MAKLAMRAPRAFRTVEQFRSWLELNHASATELVLRCFKVHAKHRGIGYREALDEALCFGWIDGVRHSLDKDSFTQRFTPRQTKSNWSVVNIRRVKELEEAGRMHAAGRKAFEARNAIAVAPYSFENKGVRLSPSFERKLRANKPAWEFFRAQPPWYRRTTAFWVMSAKREETRNRRFAQLVEKCVKGAAVPPLARSK
jgi:uncharacterized protein YdeI (YjbR/CyaY-like superfamily)